MKKWLVIGGRFERFNCMNDKGSKVSLKSLLTHRGPRQSSTNSRWCDIIQLLRVEDRVANKIF